MTFRKTGSFDELSLVNIDKPILRPGEALVRVRAAGINGSDAAGIIGTLPFVTTPRIPGRDFSGEVVEALDASGASVWGTGSDRGFTSDGTFSQYPEASILDHSRAGSMTLPWLCAWITVDTLANVKEGDNVIIIGARGGIGSAAAQLCKERGARIFGTYTSLAKVTPPSYVTPIELGSKNAIREAIAKAGLQNKIDPFNDAIFTMTANGTGRVVVMAVHAKDGLFPVNLRSFYTKALTLKGMKSSILGPLEVKEVLDDLAKKIDSGLLEGPKEVNEVDMRNMDNVKGALQEILTRASHVRSVIVP
ncbi:chaperonin 10-like protein [Suillus subalutaceus]|uniref:chaperonin 10-like protein n=1 Tax=Suillus subalutaceus TaxID=48586 RepID=UPI001B86D289|nr:chaperonin 10-like protein [Suillus subalutaceus]KAG1839576.1 chaperonin 10-like protein [Suillus subalutaceus]